MSVLTEHRQDITSFWASEAEKCRNSLAYFYNNYYLINGKIPVIPKTDKDFEDLESYYYKNRFSRRR